VNREVEPVLVADKLWFWFPGSENPFIRDLSLSIHRGEFCLMVGSSGSGKSTVLKCLCGIIPHLEEGEIAGSVTVAGRSTTECSPRELARDIGIVFQNPDDQMVCLRVADEVAWGLENLDRPHATIVEKVDQYLRMLRIDGLKERLTTSLSGGQKQKVAIASNLAMEQKVLLLDDPTTDLDPISKNEVVQALNRMRNELDLSYVVVEHDLTDLIEIADRLVVLHEGTVLFDGSPKEVLQDHYQKMVEIGVLLPQHVHLGAYLNSRGYPFGITKAEVSETVQLLMRHLGTVGVAAGWNGQEPIVSSEEVVLECDGVEFGYTPRVKTLENVSFQVRKGEFVAIIGQNGSGKSTLAKCIVGLLKPRRGDVRIAGQSTMGMSPLEISSRVGYLFQNPDHQLFLNSVKEELLFGIRQSGTAEKKR